MHEGEAKKFFTAIGAAGIISMNPSIDTAAGEKILMTPKPSHDITEKTVDPDIVAWEAEKDTIKKYQKEIEKLHAAGDHAKAYEAFEKTADYLIALFQNSNGAHRDYFLVRVQSALLNLCEYEADHHIDDNNWLAVYRKGFSVAPRLYLDAAEMYEKQGNAKERLFILEEGYLNSSFSHVDWRAPFDIGEEYANALAKGGNIIQAKEMLKQLYADFHALIELDKGKPVDRIYMRRIIDRNGDDEKIAPFDTHENFDQYLKYKIDHAWK